MPLLHLPIAERIQALWGLAERHHHRFSAPASQAARERYQAAHPTRLLALKCMDGRLHLPHITGLPSGILTPFRNLGGIFDLGWPYLGELIAEALESGNRAGHGTLLLITYHFSRGEPRRGCAGFACDRQAALAHAEWLRDQAMRLTDGDLECCYPLVCGVETDGDALLLHNARGEVLDLGLAPLDMRLAPALAAHFPEMPAAIRRDLLPLLEGNLAHQRGLRGLPRDLAVEHREWALCLGRGFDFLHLPNTALIVGPYSPDLATPIATAATIIEANMAAGRIPEDGALLLASVPYASPGLDRRRAVLKARFLADFARQTLAQEHATLLSRLHCHTAVMHWPSRRLERLDIEEP